MCFVLMLCAGLAHADIISLLSYVSMSLEDPENNPLPEGSVVLIFGSTDAVNDGMDQVGNSFVADSTRNDDVLLGMAIVGQPYYSGGGGGGDVMGTILSDMLITWDDTDVVINHLYIRFFNSTNVPDLVSSWGESRLADADANFHLVEADFDITTNSVIGDRVWYDLDGDGLQEDGESGVPGVQVVLYRDGAPLATNTTDATGNYRFSYLAAGSYQLGFVRGSYPAGYVPTVRGPTGASDADDSDPDSSTDLTELIPLGEAEQDLSWDLGLVLRSADVSLTKTAEPVFEYEQKWSIPISKGMQFTDGDYWLRLESGKPSFDVWGPGNLKSTNVLDSTWHHVVGRFTRGTNDAW
ncbi:MAG: hypothetical protein KA248_09320, partial [Kiritimatiellae bacterium]|nr:hypothetical protein [Kiritimatiellia bacterium]